MPKRKFIDEEVAEHIELLCSEAYKVFVEKKPQYEDNWQEISLDELAAVGKTKATMFFTSVKNKDSAENIVHHAADLINWATFAAMRGSDDG